MEKEKKEKKVRALVLMSGGLDSQLAAKVLLNQGIEVIALAFTSAFYGAERAKKAAGALGIAIKVVDVHDEIMALVKNPPHGLGKNLNPCIDCHAMMFRRAGELLSELEADFLASGEVLGQRPMSQNLVSLGVVAKSSGISEKILRPLSAKLLPETAMEREGLVDREKLLALSGRSRKPQMALAAEYGLTDYPSPAGGCLLTEPEFARRMRALMRIYPHPERASIEKLKVGRQFFLSEQVRLVVGRDEKDNNKLEQLAESDDIILQLAEERPGPLAILEGPADETLKKLAAAIVVRYGEPGSKEELSVELRSGKSVEYLSVLPLESSELDLYR